MVYLEQVYIKLLNLVDNHCKQGQGKKIVSVWPGVKKKKSHPGGRKKNFFDIFFRNIVVLFYSFFYLDCVHYIYLKWFISIETSSWYICCIFKTRDDFFQYILIRKFITIKDDWSNIDIVKILLLWNVLSVYKNVFESSQGRTFKLANPKREHRTERQSGRLSQS